MALDPGIALQVRPPQVNVDIPSPLDSAGRALSLQGLMQQTQLRNMQIQQEQQAVQEQQNLRTWIQQKRDAGKPIDPTEMVLANPTQPAATLAKTLNDQAKAQLEQHAAILTDHLNTQKAIDRELQGITDNDTKNQALSTAVKNGWLTSQQAAPLFNVDVKSPEWTSFAARTQAQTMDATQRGTAALNELNRRRTEGQILDTGLTNAQRTIGTVKDAEGYAKFLAELDPIVRAKLPPDWNDKTVALIQGMNKPSPSKDISPADQDRADQIAAAIAEGRQPPTTQGLYHLGAPVRAALEQKGYNLANARLDWDATTRHLSSLNSPQQLRFRQVVGQIADTTDQVETLYNRWKELGIATGFKDFNKAGLDVSTHLPGEMGSVASNLKALLADYTAELGQVYMGGNSPTDHGLKLAEQNLKAEWNPQTFGDALKRIRESIQIRKNSLNNVGAAGLSGGTSYGQTAAEPAAAAPPPAAATPTAAPAGGLPPGWVAGIQRAAPNAEPKQIWIGPDGKISTRPPKVHQGYVYVFDGTQWVRQ